jgi:carbon starvation protein
MLLQRGKSPALALVTLLPLAWLLAVTIDASVIKIWDANPKIGFLAAAQAAEARLPALQTKQDEQIKSADEAGAKATATAIKAAHTVHFNSITDAWVTGIFLVLVTLLVALSIYEWLRLLTRHKAAILSETDPVYLPASALTGSSPLPVFSIALFGFTLLKELSGEAAIDRAEVCACAQAAATGQVQPAKYRRQNAFLTATEHRYSSVNRCC